MLMQTHKNQKFVESFVGGHSQKWTWPLLSRDFKAEGCFNDF